MFMKVGAEGGGVWAQPCARRKTWPSARRLIDRVLGAALAPGAATWLIPEIRAAAGHARQVLDVGCGADSPVRAAGLRPLGIDLRPDAAAAHHAGGAPAAAASAAALPFAADAFDLVWSLGLLHHLDDATALRAVAEMARVTAPGGRTIVFDGVLPEPAWRRPLAALIRHADRGRWMRREAALRALLPAADGWTHRRLAYAWTGLEGLWCVRVKPRREGR
jgi:SAM-dependent methyltransferase